MTLSPTSIPHVRTAVVPARRGTVGALLASLRQRVESLPACVAGDWRMPVVRRLVEHAERDVRIGRAAYAIANDLTTLASHLAALEAKAGGR